MRSRLSPKNIHRGYQTLKARSSSATPLKLNSSTMTDATSKGWAAHAEQRRQDLEHQPWEAVLYVFLSSGPGVVGQAAVHVHAGSPVRERQTDCYEALATHLLQGY